MNIKIFLVLIVSLVPNLTKAESEIVKVNSNWLVLVKVDDFTDEKVCTVLPNNRNYSSIERIYIRANSSNPDDNAVAIIGSGEHINDIGLKYRVDKNPPVQLGYRFKSSVYSDMYMVEGDDYEEMISAFKSGNEVIYQFTSKKRPANNKKYEFNLLGFTEAYNFARKCDH